MRGFTGIRTASALAVGALLATTLVGTSLSSAWAAPEEERLLVSTDGVNFAPQSTLALFEDMGRVVPGDRSIEQLWVLNNTSNSAMLRVDMLHPSADDAALAAAVSLQVESERGAASTAISIEQGMVNGACTVLDDDIALAAGATMRLDFTANVDSALSEQQGTLGTVSFQLRAVLTEASAAVPLPSGSVCQVAPPEPTPTPAPGPGLDGELSNTGGASTLPLWLFGGFTIIAGILFGVLAWRRRGARDDELSEAPGSDEGAEKASLPLDD